jgi:hypothetical protein
MALLCGIGIPRLATLISGPRADTLEAFKGLFGDLHSDRYIEYMYLTYRAVLSCDELGQQILFKLYFVDDEPRDSEVWDAMGISQRTYYTLKKQALAIFQDSVELATGLDLCQQYELAKCK